MQNNQTSKLYSKMPPTALATMFVNASLWWEEQEAEAIFAAIPRQTYSGINVECRLRRDGLMSIALMWAFTYWRALARYAKTANERYTFDKPELEEAQQKYWTEAMSLHRALEQFCEESGLDADAVRFFADAATPEYILDEDVDPQLLETLVKRFRTLLG